MSMRILIADDHGIVRSGLRLLLDRQPDMEVVAEAQDGAEAVEVALANRPDLCVLDVGMPRLTGLQAAREIKAQAPEIHELIKTSVAGAPTKGGAFMDARVSHSIR